MSKAEQIIKKHIAELEQLANRIISYELDMEEIGCPLSKDELENNDRAWQDYQARRYELESVLAEIKSVAIEEVGC